MAVLAWDGHKFRAILLSMIDTKDAERRNEQARLSAGHPAGRARTVDNLFGETAALETLVSSAGSPEEMAELIEAESAKAAPVPQDRFVTPIESVDAWYAGWAQGFKEARHELGHYLPKPAAPKSRRPGRG